MTTVVRLLTAVGVTAAIFLAYQLGQRHEYQRHSVFLDDQLHRIGLTEIKVLDMIMRVHHYHAHKGKFNPNCPECYDLRFRLHQQDKIVTEENMEEVLK